MVGNFLHYIWLERHTQLVKQCDHHLLNLSAHHFWLLECEDCAWIYGKGSRASLWGTLRNRCSNLYSVLTNSFMNRTGCQIIAYGIKPEPAFAICALGAAP